MKRGFTLTELAISLLVLGILSAIGGPKMFSSQDYQTRLYYDELASFLTMAKQTALATSCDVEVTLQNASGSYTFSLAQRANCTISSTSGGTNTGAFTGSVSLRQYTATLQAPSVSIPNSITVSSTGLPFYFTPFGQAKDATSNALSSPTITVGTHQITINGQTGFVNE